MKLNVIAKAFNELTTEELYNVLYLRNQVFIVEQNCAYLDIDNKDQNCHHVLIYDDTILVGYSRIVPAGLSYQQVAFGRVLINPDYRGKGLGKAIIEESINFCYAIFGNVDIKIGAQLYLLTLYQSFGFVSDGEQYDEDGILHIDIIKAKP